MAVPFTLPRAPPSIFDQHKELIASSLTTPSKQSKKKEQRSTPPYALNSFAVLFCARAGISTPSAGDVGGNGATFRMTTDREKRKKKWRTCPRTRRRRVRSLFFCACPACSSTAPLHLHTHMYTRRTAPLPSSRPIPPHQKFFFTPPLTLRPVPIYIVVPPPLRPPRHLLPVTITLPALV